MCFVVVVVSLSSKVLLGSNDVRPVGGTNTKIVRRDKIRQTRAWTQQTGFRIVITLKNIISSDYMLCACVDFLWHAFFIARSWQRVSVCIRIQLNYYNCQCNRVHIHHNRKHRYHADFFPSFAVVLCYNLFVFILHSKCAKSSFGWQFRNSCRLRYGNLRHIHKYDAYKNNVHINKGNRDMLLLTNDWCYAVQCIQCWRI